MKNLTVLEKILLSIVGFMTASWLGWLTLTVIGIDDTKEDMNNFREWNKSQSKEIRALDKRIDKFHTE